MKRILKWIGLVVLLLAALAGLVWYTSFADNRPIVEGDIVPGARTVKDGYVSAVMLDAGPGKVALIDAGHDSSGTAIVAELTRRGLTPAAVAAIFLTHGHSDHTAGCKLFPGAQIYALATEVSLIGDAATVSHPLKDGEVVQVGDLRVETFAVPGHTAGSAVYLADGVLFFGDSAGASKDGKVMKAIRLFSKDSNENVASLKALVTRLQPRSQEVKQLAFAHTGPLTSFQPLEAFASQQK
jgi:glyoxylase-like metal-dependent hydrolase (beta-lactamase superfamily II)